MKTEKELKQAYIAAQFARLNYEKIHHSHVMKLHGVAGETNWLNVTAEQLEAIKGILTK